MLQVTYTSMCGVYVEICTWVAGQPVKGKWHGTFQEFILIASEWQKQGIDILSVNLYLGTLKELEHLLDDPKSCIEFTNVMEGHETTPGK